MTYKNQVFIPTVPKIGKGDVEGSWGIQNLLVKHGYSPGLMVFTSGGGKTVSDRAVIKTQYDNLNWLKESYGDKSVITMLSNIPIVEMDHLHHTEYAGAHVKAGINFARGLPIGGRRIVTYHLNSLMSREEFESKTEEEWKNIFDKFVAPSLRDIGRYGREQGVEVKIETCPNPEFGDIALDSGDNYRDTPFAELRNPFYFTSQSLFNFDRIRELGLGICLDVCHNHITYQTAQEGRLKGFLHKSDEATLAEEGELYSDVMDLSNEDIVHLANVRGRYSPEEGTVFEEGLPLGEGDIVDWEMKSIVERLNEKGIPFVLETKDENFSARKETRRSIEWLLGW